MAGRSRTVVNRRSTRRLYQMIAALDTEPVEGGDGRLAC